VFQYTLSGAGSFVHGREKKTLERAGPGTLFLASPDQEYLYYCRGGEPWEFVWIMLEGEFTDQVCAELRDPCPLFAVDPGSTPVTFLKTLLERLSGPFVLDPYSLSAAAYDFLVQLLRVKRDQAAGTDDRFLRSVRDFTVKNLRDVDLGRLAARFGYSPKYFISLFRERMNTTPHRYILLQKVRYASLLLMNTKKSVREIADEVGFAEDNYFSRIFRQHQGLSPTAFRERNRGVLSVDDIVVL
jgi:AraC-like DNA-binding protein